MLTGRVANKAALTALELLPLTVAVRLARRPSGLLTGGELVLDGPGVSAACVGKDTGVRDRLQRQMMDKRQRGKHEEARANGKRAVSAHPMP